MAGSEGEASPWEQLYIDEDANKSSDEALHKFAERPQSETATKLHSSTDENCNESLDVDLYAALSPTPEEQHAVALLPVAVNEDKSMDSDLYTDLLPEVEDPQSETDTKVHSSTDEHCNNLLDVDLYAALSPTPQEKHTVALLPVAGNEDKSIDLDLYTDLLPKVEDPQSGTATKVYSSIDENCNNSLDVGLYAALSPTPEEQYAVSLLPLAGNEDKSTDLDLYTDLLAAESEQQQTAKVEARKKLIEQHKLLEQLQSINARLENQNKHLLRNISVLFTTAKHEIGRKDKQIRDLQERLDSMVFRRGRRFGTPSSSHSDLDNDMQHGHTPLDRDCHGIQRNDHRDTLPFYPQSSADAVNDLPSSTRILPPVPYTNLSPVTASCKNIYHKMACDTTPRRAFSAVSYKRKRDSADDTATSSSESQLLEKQVRQDGCNSFKRRRISILEDRKTRAKKCPSMEAEDELKAVKPSIIENGDSKMLLKYLHVEKSAQKKNKKDTTDFVPKSEIPEESKSKKAATELVCKAAISTQRKETSKHMRKAGVSAQMKQRNKNISKKEISAQRKDRSDHVPKTENSVRRKDHAPKNEKSPRWNEISDHVFKTEASARRKEMSDHVPKIVNSAHRKESIDHVPKTENSSRRKESSDHVPKTVNSAHRKESSDHVPKTENSARRKESSDRVPKTVNSARKKERSDQKPKTDHSSHRKESSDRVLKTKKSVHRKESNVHEPKSEISAHKKKKNEVVAKAAISAQPKETTKCSSKTENYSEREEASELVPNVEFSAQTKERSDRVPKYEISEQRTEPTDLELNAEIAEQSKEMAECVIKANISAHSKETTEVAFGAEGSAQKTEMTESLSKTESCVQSMQTTNGVEISPLKVETTNHVPHITNSVLGVTKLEMAECMPKTEINDLLLPTKKSYKHASEDPKLEAVPVSDNEPNRSYLKRETDTVLMSEYLALSDTSAMDDSKSFNTDPQAITKQEFHKESCTDIFKLPDFCTSLISSECALPLLGNLEQATITDNKSEPKKFIEQQIFHNAVIDKSVSSTKNIFLNVATLSEPHENAVTGKDKNCNLPSNSLPKKTSSLHSNSCDQGQALTKAKSSTDSYKSSHSADKEARKSKRRRSEDRLQWKKDVAKSSIIDGKKSADKYQECPKSKSNREKQGKCYVSDLQKKRDSKHYKERSSQFRSGNKSPKRINAIASIDHKRQICNRKSSDITRTIKDSDKTSRNSNKSDYVKSDNHRQTDSKDRFRNHSRTKENTDPPRHSQKTGEKSAASHKPLNNKIENKSDDDNRKTSDKKRITDKEDRINCRKRNEDAIVSHRHKDRRKNSEHVRSKITVKTEISDNRNARGNSATKSEKADSSLTFQTNIHDKSTFIMALSQNEDRHCNTKVNAPKLVAETSMTGSLHNMSVVSEDKATKSSEQAEPTTDVLVLTEDLEDGEIVDSEDEEKPPRFNKLTNIRTPGTRNKTSRTLTPIKSIITSPTFKKQTGTNSPRKRTFRRELDRQQLLANQKKMEQRRRDVLREKAKERARRTLNDRRREVIPLPHTRRHIGKRAHSPSFNSRDRLNVRRERMSVHSTRR